MVEKVLNLLLWGSHTFYDKALISIYVKIIFSFKRLEKLIGDPKNNSKLRD